MLEILWIVGALVLGLHGLLHLMGFFAYWPLALIPDLAYKTAILGGQLELGAVGMRAFSVLWLVVAVGYFATCLAMIGRWRRWQQVLLAITLISFLITLLDWQAAFRGTFIDFAILVVFLISSQSIKLIPARGP